jgi:hypothetical protein
MNTNKLGQGGTENILLGTKDEVWFGRGWESENWKCLEKLQNVCSSYEVTWKTLIHYQ